jgi:hypothetical protein
VGVLAASSLELCQCAQHPEMGTGLASSGLWSKFTLMKKTEKFQLD